MWISPTLYGKFWLWWNYEISELEAMDKLSSLYSDCCVSAAILGEFFFFFPVCYKFICSYYSLGDLLNTHIQKASEFQSPCIWRRTRKVPDMEYRVPGQLIKPSVTFWVWSVFKCWCSKPVSWILSHLGF